MSCIRSNALSLQVHVEIQNSSSLLSCIVRFPQRWCLWGARVVPCGASVTLQRQAVVCPRAGPVPSVTGFTAPGRSFLKAPGSHFCGDSIWSHRIRRGVGALGRAHRAPTLGAICKLLSEGARAQPRTGGPCSPHCVRGRAPFPR